MNEKFFLLCLVVVISLLIRHLKSIDGQTAKPSILGYAFSTLIIAGLLTISIIFKWEVFFDGFLQIILTSVLILQTLYLYFLSIILFIVALFRPVIYVYGVAIKSSKEAINRAREVGLETEGKICRFIIFAEVAYWLVDEKHMISVAGSVLTDIEKAAFNEFENVEAGAIIQILDQVFELQRVSNDFYLNEKIINH